MRVDKLEMYIDKQVAVTTCFDDKQLRGVLKRQVRKNLIITLAYIIKKGFYIVVFEDGANSYLFRASHVKKIKEEKEK